MVALAGGGLFLAGGMAAAGALAASAAVAAAAMPGATAQQLVRRGMDRFREVRSLRRFVPRSPVLDRAGVPLQQLRLVPLPPLSSPQNDVEGSLADFDAALEGRPSIRPFLWQRGLSLYYLGQFEAGAAQARRRGLSVCAALLGLPPSAHRCAAALAAARSSGRMWLPTRTTAKRRCGRSCARRSCWGRRRLASNFCRCAGLVGAPPHSVSR